jgi:hypothetical protein
MIKQAVSPDMTTHIRAAAWLTSPRGIKGHQRV